MKNNTTNPEVKDMLETVQEIRGMAKELKEANAKLQKACDELEQKMKGQKTKA